jgi:tetratricopeptide (TPR) repeat protein
MDRYDEALADLDRAVELLPDNAWILANRGETHRLAKRYAEALADFDRAVELDATYGWAIASRGQTYRALGRHDEALTDLSHATELGLASAWCHCEIALVMHLLGKPEEREHWRTARELFAAEDPAGGPPAADTRSSFMAIHCALGEWAEAAAELDRFLDCGPSVWEIRDALDDLAELESVLALDPAVLQPLRRKLDDAQRSLRPGASS